MVDSYSGSSVSSWNRMVRWEGAANNPDKQECTGGGRAGKGISD